MKKLSITREIDAPADVLWWLFTDPEQWPRWGPSVRSAELHDGTFEQGATGTVTTPVGITFGFEITDYVDGASWGWKVAGMPATHHTVESLGTDRCRVGFSVPWVVAPYLAACQIALRRIETLAVDASLGREAAQ